MAFQVGNELAGQLALNQNNKKDLPHMLSTIAFILIVLWLFGLVTSYTLGGFIHILLVLAVIMVLLRIINGRRVL